MLSQEEHARELAYIVGKLTKVFQSRLRSHFEHVQKQLELHGISHEELRGLPLQDANHIGGDIVTQSPVEGAPSDGTFPCGGATFSSLPFPSGVPMHAATIDIAKDSEMSHEPLWSPRDTLSKAAIIKNTISKHPLSEGPPMKNDFLAFDLGSEDCGNDVSVLSIPSAMFGSQDRSRDSTSFMSEQKDESAELVRLEKENRRALTDQHAAVRQAAHLLKTQHRKIVKESTTRAAVISQSEKRCEVLDENIHEISAENVRLMQLAREALEDLAKEVGADAGTQIILEKIRNNLLCSTAGGSAFVSEAPDDLESHSDALHVLGKELSQLATSHLNTQSRAADMKKSKEELADNTSRALNNALSTIRDDFGVEVELDASFSTNSPACRDLQPKPPQGALRAQNTKTDKDIKRTDNKNSLSVRASATSAETTFQSTTRSSLLSANDQPRAAVGSSPSSETLQSASDSRGETRPSSQASHAQSWVSGTFAQTENSFESGREQLQRSKRRKGRSNKSTSRETVYSTARRQIDLGNLSQLHDIMSAEVSSLQEEFDKDLNERRIYESKKEAAMHSPDLALQIAVLLEGLDTDSSIRRHKFLSPEDAGRIRSLLSEANIAVQALRSCRNGLNTTILRKNEIKEDIQRQIKSDTDDLDTLLVRTNAEIRRSKLERRDLVSKYWEWRRMKEVGDWRAAPSFHDDLKLGPKTKEVCTQNEIQAETLPVQLTKFVKLMREGVNIQARLRLLEDVVKQVDEATKSLETILQCPLCGDLMREPVSLWPCGHNFCHSCYELSDRLTISRGVHRCAICDTVGTEGAIPNVVLSDIFSKWEVQRCASGDLLSSVRKVKTSVERLHQRNVMDRMSAASAAILVRHMQHEGIHVDAEEKGHV